jgi:hypothetical protein
MSDSNQGHVVPKHYDKKVQPWDLQKCMESSGNAFVDSRRTDAIEYCFRNKGDMLGDLRKARHCIDAAIEALELPPPLTKAKEEEKARITAALSVPGCVPVMADVSRLMDLIFKQHGK